ncbi:SDR family NAD(P)-dependent oxidoreductase [Deinococcus pimensis]|uniref:SDR family NAD(P)-dependent oxidoreductase n=1 Tax=Deinococcus pimensis TaxID=309888 RepID=UPI0004859068|nr:SDR family oxidoreductase [Deinococcus pimensis]
MPNALITGASRGLGLALAQALHLQGWTLTLTARTARDLELARLTLGAGADVTALSGDVSDDAHASALIEAAARYGRIDALVNNASTLGPTPRPTLAHSPTEALRRVFDVNVLAPLRLVQLALPHLTPGARILNLSSDAAVEAYEGWGGYGASKAALDHLSRTLAAEHPDLRVYSVDPGDMNTRMHQEAFPGEDISDRPPPEASVPGLLHLLLGHAPSGRYVARDLTKVTS